MFQITTIARGAIASLVMRVVWAETAHPIAEVPPALLFSTVQLTHATAYCYCRRGLHVVKTTTNKSNPTAAALEVTIRAALAWQGSRGISSDAIGQLGPWMYPVAVLLWVPYVVMCFSKAAGESRRELVPRSRATHAKFRGDSKERVDLLGGVAKSPHRANHRNH